MKKLMVIAALVLTGYCSLLTAFAQGTPGTVRYPTNVDTLDSLFGRITDNPQTALNGSISSSATTITTVASGTAGFGSSGSLKIDNEIIYYIGKTSNTFIGVIRGRDGSIATSHVSGRVITSPLLTVHHRTLVDAIIAVETDVATIDHSIGSGDIIAALGYTPMRGSNNLSEITSGPTARANLGLGSMATQSSSSVAITGGTIAGVTFGSLNVGGTVTATAFVGNGAGITGLSGATGGVSNTGSTTIGADTDANGVGIISLQIGGVEKWAIGNDVGNHGYLGWGTNAPVAALDFAAVATPGATRIERVRVQEAGSGDFGTIFFATAGSFGETRRDNQLCDGYNMGGPGQVAGEHSFARCTESRYKTSEGTLQLEWYYDYHSGSEAPFVMSVRPMAISIGLTTNQVLQDFNASSIRWWDQKGERFALGSPWMGLNMNGDDDASLTFNGPMTVQYEGTMPYALYSGGVGLIGRKNGSVGRLFGGGIGSEFAWLFPDAALSDNKMCITLGGSTETDASAGRMCYNLLAADSAPGWQYRDTSGVWHTFNEELGIYQKNYALLRNLGNGDGDTTEIGTIDLENYSGIFEMFTQDRESFTGKHFVVPSMYSIRNGLGWLELTPAQAAVSTETDTYAVDLNGASGKLRIRRKGGTSTGPQNIYITLKRYGITTGPGAGGNAFTSSSTTGTGGTISGVYGGTRFGEKNGVPYIYDGSVMQPVSIGAADSGGTGYRALRIPN